MDNAKENPLLAKLGFCFAKQCKTRRKIPFSPRARILLRKTMQNKEENPLLTKGSDFASQNKEDLNMDTVLSVVRNVTIFMILSTIVGNLVSKSTYRKYFTFFTGIILIIIVIGPIMTMLKGDDLMSYFLKENQWKEYMNEKTVEFKVSGDLVSKEWLSSYEEQLEKGVRTYFEDQNLTVDDVDVKMSKKDYGVISSIRVELVDAPNDVSEWLAKVSELYGVEEENIHLISS